MENKKQLTDKINMLHQQYCSLIEELEKERHFNNLLLHTLPLFFVSISPDGKVLDMNDSMLQRLGYNIEEVRGKDYLSTFVPESDRKILSEIFTTLISSNKPTFNENRVLTKNGEEIIVEWHGRPVLKKDGTVDYFFSIGIDITERKKALNELKKTKNFLNNIIDSSLDCIIVTDEKGYITRVNKAFLNLLQYNEDEILGKHISEFTPMEEGTYECSTGVKGLGMSVTYGIIRRHDGGIGVESKAGEGGRV